MRRLGPLVAAALACVLGLPYAAGPSRAQSPPYQVIVYGASPVGLAAACTAAQNGLRTLLLGDDRTVGGVVSHGWLTTWDLSRGPDGRVLTTGFFTRLYQAFGGHDSFDLQRAVAVMNDLAFHTPHLTTLLGATVVAATTQGGVLTQVTVRTASGLETFQAPYYIDASGNADLAAQAGVPMQAGFSGGGVDHAVQAATLIFRLQGVDWAQVLAYVHRGTRYLAQHPGPIRSAWGYEIPGFVSPVPGVQLRGLNLAEQDDGSVLVSGLWVFGVNPLDPASLAAGRAQALAAIPAVVAFLRAHAPGFANARLDGVAPRLYVRESRQILADRTLTVVDELTNRTFPDSIAVASYPIDVQALFPGEQGAVVGKPLGYEIPLRSLVPRNLQNLLVVGRSAGYSPVAAGSARTLPVGIAEGQAAGDAVAIAAARGLSIQALVRSPSAVAAVRRLLVAQGATVDQPPGLPHALPVPVWDAKPVSFLLENFLLQVGYGNRFDPPTPPTPAWFALLLDNVALRLGRPMPEFGPLPWVGRLSVTKALELYAEATRSVTGVASLPGRPGGLVDRVLAHTAWLTADEAYLLAWRFAEAIAGPARAADLIPN